MPEHIWISHFRWRGEDSTEERPESDPGLVRGQEGGEVNPFRTALGTEMISGDEGKF